jgi:hypothetical protein
MQTLCRRRKNRRSYVFCVEQTWWRLAELSDHE